MKTIEVSHFPSGSEKVAKICADFGVKPAELRAGDITSETNGTVKVIFVVFFFVFRNEDCCFREGTSRDLFDIVSIRPLMPSLKGNSSPVRRPDSAILF